MMVCETRTRVWHVRGIVFAHKIAIIKMNNKGRHTRLKTASYLHIIQLYNSHAMSSEWFDGLGICIHAVEWLSEQNMHTNRLYTPKSEFLREFLWVRSTCEIVIRLQTRTHIQHITNSYTHVSHVYSEQRRECEHAYLFKRTRQPCLIVLTNITPRACAHTHSHTDTYTLHGFGYARIVVPDEVWTLTSSCA